MCKMSKIFNLIFLAAFVLVSKSAKTQDTLLFQNFQDSSFGQFTTVDQDGLALNTDFTGLSGSFDIIPVSGPSDFRAVAVSSFATSGTADNWLISPLIQIDNPQTVLSWSASSLSGDAFLLESYRILVSTTGPAIGDFTNLLLDISAEEMSEKSREIDLSAFAGQAIHIAFNHTGTDNYALTIDDILVSAASAGNSVELVKICGDRYQDLSSRNLTLQVVNTGSEVIQDLLVAGSINTDEGDQLFNDLNILPRDTAYLSFSDFYPFEAEKYEIIATITSVNATPITGQSSVGTFYMVEGPPAKKLVIEEATSTTCGWCPEGLVQKRYLDLTYGEEVINISVHSEDPMENTVYSLGLQNSSGFGGYPSGNINRLSSLPHAKVEQYFLEDFSGVAPLELDFEYNYDSASRDLQVTLNGTAHTTLENTAHRLSFVILEDRVTGEGPSFAQANNYSSEALDVLLEDVNGQNWQALSNPVPAEEMTYNDVARDIVGGYDGILESIANVKNGENFSYDFDYTLSSAFDENEIWLVALALDVETGEIVQAEEKKLEFESAVEENSKDKIFSLYPNPASSIVYLSSKELNTQMDIEIYDGLGIRKLSRSIQMTNNGLYELSLEDIKGGLYTIKLTVGKEFETKKLLVH